MIKSKGSPKVPKRKINIPQIVTPVNYQLAVTGLTLMLELIKKTFTTIASTSVVSTTSEHAVLILPVLDRYLSSYALVLSKCLDLSKVSTTDSAGSSLTPNASLDTLTSSLRSLMLKGTNVANLLESSTINTLKVLYNLVRYSSHVRNALICDTYSSTEAKKPSPGDGTKAGTVPEGSKAAKEGSSLTRQGGETSVGTKPSTTASQVNPKPSTSKQGVSLN